MGAAIRREEGMSVLEIMIAAVILFIVLTGVLGLVGTTTLMGADAKQRNVMVNALNAYVEHVQSLPFAAVALAADGGALASEETTTVGEFTVTIRPTVTAGTNDALKNLTVAITVSANARRTVSMTTTVPIRDRNQFMTQANRTPETDPSIEFVDAYTPAEAAVVWDTSCQGATGVLRIAVSATAAEGRTITNVALWIDDAYLARNPAGSQATWNPATVAFSENDFVWNTRQTEDVIQDDGSYLPIEMIADGMRTVSAYVLDDNTVSVFTVRHLLVDNHAPGLPGIPVASVSSNTQVGVSWTEASDGTTLADHYQVRLFQQPSGDTASTSPFERWPEVTVGTPTGASLSLAGLTSFSRYYPVVRALSPRGLASDYTAGTPIFVTRPLVAGSYKAVETSKNKTLTFTSTNLTCTPPTFSTSGLTYAWYRIDPTHTSGVQVGTSQTLSSDSYDMNIQGSTSAGTVKYYCVVTYTPLGSGGGVQKSIQSNTIATTATGEITVTAYGIGTW